MEDHPVSKAHGGLNRILLQPEVALAVIICVALGLRLYLIQFHDVISVDGTSYVNTAKALKAGSINNVAIYGFYPVLIWLTSLTGIDIELAGRLVSATMGSALAIPVYLLGREIFSKKTALVACMLIAVWEPLVGWSCEVMTQSTYIALAFTGIYLVWRMMHNPSLITGAMAGLCLALAFTTRPEGLLLFFVMPLALLPWKRARRPDSWPWSTLAAYCGGFLTVFCINLLLVHHVTGHWQLSAKTGSALTDALGYYLRIKDYNYIPNIEQVGYLDILVKYPGFIFKNSFSNSVLLVKTLLPVSLWLAACGGFIFNGLSGGNRSRMFLLSTFAPLAVIIIYYYVSPEYTQQYLPVLFLWVGEGCTRLEAILAARLKQISAAQRDLWRSFAPVTFVIILLFTGTIFNRYLPEDGPQAAYDPQTDGGRRDQKVTGLLLKKHLPPGKIMTRWARIAYYSEREYVAIPNASIEEILHTAREAGVRFIVVDGGLAEYRPSLEVLYAPFDLPDLPERLLLVTPDEPVMKDLKLRPYLFNVDPTSLGVAVYEVVS